MHKPLASIAMPQLNLADARQALRKRVKTYRCTVVTPLYGGGVVAGEVDREMPVRPTAIRGQLRFFWRLTQRENFSQPNGQGVDWKKMFEAERAIFGGLGSAETLAASKVIVRVRDVNKPTLAAAAVYGRRQNEYKTFPAWEHWAGGREGGYALFPAQGKASRQRIEEEPKKLAKPGLSFVLEIEDEGLTPDQQQQVETALRWWASFGGVGARGRRGLGAVHVQDCEPVTAEEAKAYRCTLVLQEERAKDALDAWKRAIGALQQFRQGPGFGRNRGNQTTNHPRPGRSRWPEPDTIRELTNTHAPQHEPVHPAKGRWFPRAYFGLPIIFHFKDKEDPGDATLKPSGKERMASPIILRPYWSGSEWRAAALALPMVDASRILQNLHLQVGRHSYTVWAWPSIDEKEKDQRKKLAEKIGPLHMICKGERENPYPVSVFMTFFKDPNKYLNNRS
jgi:CRISPR-associated protein Cmr1